MAIVTTDDKHYKDIAKALRRHLQDAVYKPAQMANAIDRVHTESFELGEMQGSMNGYNKGFVEGKTEGVAEGKELGKTEEYNRFWDAYQNYGNRTDYSSGFRGAGWTDDTYNPKYPINASESAGYIFNTSRMTNTIVDVTVCKNISNSFSYNNVIVTIPKLTFVDITQCTDTFRNCTRLENVTFGGSFGISGLDLHWSTKLTVDSMLSLFACLVDYKGSGSTYTLTLGTTNLAKLTDEQKAIATEKGWTLA